MQEYINKLVEFINELPIIKIYLENKKLKKEVHKLEDKINDMQWGFKNIDTITNGYIQVDESLWINAFISIKEQIQKFI